METCLPRWEQLRPWLLLHLLPALGPIRSRQLLDQIKHPDALLKPDSIGTLRWLPEPTQTALSQWHRGRGAFWDYANRQLCRIEGWSEQAGCHLLSAEDEAYPPLLAELHDPPPLLYVEGDASLLQSPQIALVGSRHCTRQGGEMAYEMAYQLALSGLTVTSGFARGIDSQAHEGSVRAQQPTLAVLGTGIDRCYPAQNRQLRETVLAGGGALVSEFPLGMAPRPGNFPRRNRIISGLSLGVLVVEAAVPSGSLLTAQLALEQGREVFAVPGSIRQGKSAGCHRLIRDGACLVESSEEVVAALAPQFLQPLADKYRKGESSAAPGGGVQLKAALAPEQRSLIELLDFEPCCLDLLVVRSCRTVTELMTSLQQLELEGWVERVAGGYQRRRG
ncbi:DNA-processing protein DprA [Aestuariirhabdus litorea]|uniref:DNA-protecting protein DprA n=1 Tax=Aestuariirhabdus litorea TaxID=2528527 RepID=A0A3P3VLH4_9GAMM|nr:DNA-processing protein DprA [Aestuariirhabdus litorea]RRJ82579.1 DNA-protecting protein DprA [Aestuariirhabdus litorea]RWW92737.1 DNA-protecting protein DprA [Endozoicomonadaceae bacterium GTF-13]